MLSLAKSDRIKGRNAVSTLLAKGRWGFSGSLKYCYLPTDSEDGGVGKPRVMVSVPKRLFKRAVKRNLLKRRIREAYRKRKDLISKPIDIMFLYNTNEILDSKSIDSQVESILKNLGNERQR